MSAKMTYMADPLLRPALTVALRRWWAETQARLGFWSTLREFCGEIWTFLRDSTPEHRRRRYGDAEYDWDFHVNTTSATVGWRDRLLGVFHSPYQPTEPALFREMMDQLKIDFSRFTFIDLGSGKGRTLLMASEYPFRRIMGVELLPELHRAAQDNLENYKSEFQKCFHMEAICADVRDFEFPREPTVLYLFNPLPEAGLEKVIRRLEQSLRRDPRQVYIIYHNPLLERLLVGNSSLKKTGGTHQYSIFTHTG
jgi:SAM-dependent methyltransferase